jgi:ABC-type phosphate transport system permease subunit
VSQNCSILPNLSEIFMASESLPPNVVPPTPPSTSASPRSLKARRGPFGNNFGDDVFYWGTMLFSAAALALSILIGARLIQQAYPAISQYGLSYITSTVWNPVLDKYGAWPYVWGTLMSSFVALLLAVPIGIGTAIFLAELAPKWMRTPLSFMVELLAAVPSVVYGLWGRLVMVPWLQGGPQTWLADTAYPLCPTLKPISAKQRESRLSKTTACRI